MRLTFAWILSCCGLFGRPTSNSPRPVLDPDDDTPSPHTSLYDLPPSRNPNNNAQPLRVRNPHDDVPPPGYDDEIPPQREVADTGNPRPVMIACVLESPPLLKCRLNRRYRVMGPTGSGKTQVSMCIRQCTLRTKHTLLPPVHQSRKWFGSTCRYDLGLGYE